MRGASATYLYNGLAEAYLLAAEKSTAGERDRWLKQARGACRAAVNQGQFVRLGLPEAYACKASMNG